MSELFLYVLNMSLTASYVILFVIFVRLLLKKAPKVISYALWGVVAFRLIIPFSFESKFSLMPRNTSAVPIPHDIIYQQSPQINSGIEIVDSFVSSSLPTPAFGASANPLQIYIGIGAYIWVLGIIALLVYSLVSILILKGQLKSAQLIEKNIFEAKNLKTPFVLGLIRPKIYLPVGLNVEERSYILLHEQTHIYRKDHIIKVLAFLTLSIHWFNPLVWIAFMLMGTDMELSCDERVLKEMNEDIKKPYANSLLSLATEKRILNVSSLAFGEGNVRGRIKNVLNYKKPRFWVVVCTCALIIIIGIGFTTNPKVSRHFSMTGNRLSDLQPLDITQTIGDSVDRDFSEIMLAPDNFGLIVSADFSYVESEAIRFLYDIGDESCKAAQLRIFIEDSEFFITDSKEWVAPKKQIFHLYSYLEALKYLPKEAIWAMTDEKPQRYSIELSANNNKYNEGRQIYYNKNGVTENNSWQIRLDIQPLYGTEDSDYHGVGNDILHVYYNASELADNRGWTD